MQNKNKLIRKFVKRQCFSNFNLDLYSRLIDHSIFLFFYPKNHGNLTKKIKWIVINL